MILNFIKMKRETFLTLVIVALLLLNFGTLGYLFLGKQHGPGKFPPPGGRVGNLLMEQLQFTGEQKKSFEQLRYDHRTAMNKLDEQNKDLLVAYLELLKDESVNAATKDSLEKQMAAIQTQKADITLNHFKQVKQLLTPEQQKRFNDLIPDLIEVVAPAKQQGPPGPPPPGN